MIWYLVSISFKFPGKHFFCSHLIQFFEYFIIDVSITWFKIQKLHLVSKFGMTTVQCMFENELLELICLFELNGQNHLLCNPSSTLSFMSWVVKTTFHIIQCATLSFVDRYYMVYYSRKLFSFCRENSFSFFMRKMLYYCSNCIVCSRRDITSFLSSPHFNLQTVRAPFW